MKYAKLERIVKTYYDNLEEGKVLGRKCTACGHIEFPPYLACNECGNLDTEWVDLTNTRAKITQVLPPLNVFPEAEFAEANGGFVAVCVKIDGADPYVTSMVHVGKDAYERIRENMENIVVKPYVIQGADTKICSWVDVNFKEEPKKAAPKAEKKETPAPAAEKAAPAAAPSENDEVAKAVIEAAAESAAAGGAEELDEVAKVVIDAAADAYDVDASGLSLATDIREDLSPQSMKMIVMLSNIEDALDVTIDITEAGELNTLGDFAAKVREKR